MVGPFLGVDGDHVAVTGLTAAVSMWRAIPDPEHCWAGGSGTRPGVDACRCPGPGSLRAAPDWAVAVVWRGVRLMGTPVRHGGARAEVPRSAAGRLRVSGLVCGEGR